MANTIKHDLSKALKRGDGVVCLKCGKGIYKPFNTSSEKAHSFTCDKCGDHVHFTPNITVE